MPTLFPPRGHPGSGGRVRLASLSAPLSEFDNEAKGDALYAMVSDRQSGWPGGCRRTVLAVLGLQHGMIPTALMVSPMQAGAGAVPGEAELRQATWSVAGAHAEKCTRTTVHNCAQLCACNCGGVHDDAGRAVRLGELFAQKQR